MKRYIRFDSVGGASGDMILAALASAGADLDAIEKQLNSFFPEKLHIKCEPASGSGLNGVLINVHCHHHHHHDDTHWPDAEGKQGHHHHDHPPSPPGRTSTSTHPHTHSPTHPSAVIPLSGTMADMMADKHTHRGLKEIAALIEGSPLSSETKQLSIAVFTKLAEAEAKVHGKTVDTIHFHEVGAWDSVADIVGSCLALEQLDIVGISCGALPCGTGTIRCAHGEMPNPAPATQILLEGLPVVQTDEPFELVTPTGAALLATWLEKLEKPSSENVPVTSGFGFGSRRLNNRPNVLRATIIAEQPVGRALRARPYAPRENKNSFGLFSSMNSLTVLETNLDDCNPEWLGALVDDLLTNGALDVWHTPIVMKKGRPAVMLSVLTEQDKKAICEERIFRSTTTFGIRSYSVDRTELEREFIEVETEWGKVPVKCGKLNGITVTVAPEHDACAHLARENGLTVKEVYETAKSAVYVHLHPG